MKIFSNFFKGRDAPINRTSGSAYSFFMGGSTAGKNVNERSAMQMTAVYACVRILSEAIAGLPLHVYHYNDDGGIEWQKQIDYSRVTPIIEEEINDSLDFLKYEVEKNNLPL